MSEQRLSVRRTGAWSACRARLTSSFTKWILRISIMKFTHTKSKLAMMKKQLSKPKIHAKCVMSAFSVSMEWKYSFESGELSVESFHFHIPINIFCLNMLYNCTTFLTFATWLEKLSHLRIIIATLWRS